MTDRYGNSGAGLGTALVILLWLTLLIVAPAAYLLIGPAELQEIWDRLVSR